MKTIGDILIDLRGDKKAVDVAKAIDITPQALWNYENNLRVPRDQTKVKIANYYKKSVEDIFFKVDSNN